MNADPELTSSDDLWRNEFRDHVPQVLAEFESRLLEELHPGATPRKADHSYASVEHGEHRWQQGYDLREVIFGELLRRHGAVASMSRAANCYDNARTESFWATLKGELIGDHVFATRAEAKSAIFQYIEVFYNRVRLHGAPDFYSPVDFGNQLN